MSDKNLIVWHEEDQTLEIKPVDPVAKICHEPPDYGTKCILEVMDLCAEKLDDARTRELLKAARAELNQLITQKNWYRIMLETTEELLRREKPDFSVEAVKNTPAINIISMKQGDRIKIN